MRELSVAEQRYDAVLAVIRDGQTVKDVAAAVGVSRQSLHTWLARSHCVQHLPEPDSPTNGAVVLRLIPDTPEPAMS